MRGPLALAVALGLAGHLAPRDLAAQPRHVIPPGQEAFALAMLGGEDRVGGCALQGASIEPSYLVARYDCGGPAPVEIELHHPDDVDDANGLPRTERFVLRGRGALPDALSAAVARRVRERESGWRWQDVAVAPLDLPVLGSLVSAPTPPDAADAQDLARGLRLYRERRFRDAFERFRTLAARSGGRGRSLALLAAAEAPLADPEFAERLAGESAARPDDPLASFVAGVAMHYAEVEHVRGAGERTRFRRAAADLLARARAAYEFEPRVLVYLGLALHRDGRTDEGLATLERAARAAPDDPDVYFARAEALRASDPARARADLERYVRLASERGGDAAIEPERVERVRSALRGESPGTDEGGAHEEERRRRDEREGWARSPGRFGARVLAAGAIASALEFAWRKRRRARGRTPPGAAA